MENGNKPATKKDLAELEERLRGDMSSLEERLAERLTERLTERLAEKIHDAETRLLNAFYGFAESNRIQLVDMTRSDSALRERLDVVENRLLEVEKRLNWPRSS